MSNQEFRRTRNSIGYIWCIGFDGGFGYSLIAPYAYLICLHAGSEPRCVANCWLVASGRSEKTAVIGGGVLHER